MASYSSLRPRLRLAMQDLPLGFQEILEADGETDRFILPVEYVSGPLVITAENGSLVPSNAYTVDTRTGIVTFTTPPTSDLTVSGQAHAEFMDADLNVFMETAVTQHLHGREDDYGRPLALEDLPPVEHQLVVLLAQVEALWALATRAAMEVDIMSPDGVRIPASQRYSQIMGLIAMIKARYDELAQALNVGLHRVQVLNLRRVSRTTGRLVPIYRSREYDEIGPPERQYPPIDRGI